MESWVSESNVGAAGANLSLRFGQQFVSKGLYFPLLWGTRTLFLHVELESPLCVHIMLIRLCSPKWAAVGEGLEHTLILRGYWYHTLILKPAAGLPPDLLGEFKHSPFNASCSRGTWWTHPMPALGYLETKSCESGLRSHLVSCSRFSSSKKN